MCPTCGKRVDHLAATLWGRTFYRRVLCTCEREAEEAARAEEEDRARQQRIEDLLAEGQSGMDGRERAQTFKRFERQYQPEAHEKALAFAEHAAGWQVLVLASVKPGTGKSHLCAAIVNHAIRRRLLPAKFITVVRFEEAVKASYDRDAKTTEARVLREYGAAPLLALDDFGVGTATPWAHTLLLALVNERYRRELPTVISTNLDGAAFAALAGERMASRIREGVTWVALREGTDYRLVLRERRQRADNPA